MTTPNSFNTIEGRNVLAANQFHNATISISDPQDSRQDVSACRAFPFRRNDDFVQRPAISAQIERLLPSKPSYQDAALWGLGGSGKTQLALEYAYGRCSSDPACSMFWVHADTEMSFARDYKWIATKLGIADDLKGDKLLTAVRVAVEGLPQWIMVLDNADDLTLFGVSRSQDATAGAHDLSDYIPRGPVGTVLWTSRNKRIVGTLVGRRRGVNVLQMTGAEAGTLFQTMADLNIDEGHEEHNSMTNLLVELGRLPLAITQAAAYIHHRKKKSLGEYLVELQQDKKHWKILQRSEYDAHRRPQASTSLLKTWNISIKYIQRNNELAYKILTVLAYVDSQNIPFAMVERIVKAQMEEDGHEKGNVSGAGDGDPEDDDNSVECAVAWLEEFSFLTPRRVEDRHNTLGRRLYDMHKLVHMAVSFYLHVQTTDGEAEGRSARIAFKVTDSLFPQEWQYDTWAECELYLGHAQRSADWAQAYSGEENAARLLARVSEYLLSRGRYGERERVDLAMVDLHRRVFGNKHPQTLSSRAMLAVTYQFQGRYNEAESLKREILKLRREILGEKHPDTISSMESLATTYNKQGKYDEDEEIAIYVLQLRRETLGEKNPETIWSMADLAATYYAQGRYAEAEPLYIQVLELQREVLGEQHKDTIRSMADLAAVHYGLGRYNEAEAIFENVSQLQRETLGEKHPDTLRSLAGLATTYYAQGRYNEAQPIYSEVLQMRREVLRQDHPETIQSMADLATTYHELERWDEAESIYKDVLQLRRNVLGDDSPDTLDSMADLATVYHSQKRYNEAELIKIEVLQLRRQAFGDQNPDTLRSMVELAATYRKQERYNEAEVIYSEALQSQRHVLGKEHPETIRTSEELEKTRLVRDQIRQVDDVASTSELLATRISLLFHLIL